MSPRNILTQKSQKSVGKELLNNLNSEMQLKNNNYLLNTGLFKYFNIDMVEAHSLANI